MKLSVRNSFLDMASFVLHVRARNRRFKRASDSEIPIGAMNRLAAGLHPRAQSLEVTARRVETPSTVTFTLEPVKPDAQVAHFRAGQYLALEAAIGAVAVSRPFSISNTPDDSLARNCYEITIRDNDDGFFAPWAVSGWEAGTRLLASDPQGFFHYERLRDFPDVVCLAGGSGVTPFRSILPDLLRYEPETRITLLYGVTDPAEIIFRSEWEALAQEHADRFRFIPVCSDDHRGAATSEAWSGERGFLSADLIRDVVTDVKATSFFICGPEAMHRYLETELATLELRPKQVRRENFGGAGPAPAPAGREAGSTRQTAENEQVTISVRVRGTSDDAVIPAKRSETVLVALERAGLNPPAMCRSGECGWCRSELLSGTVATPPDPSGLRAADIKFSWFHPCNSWPETDLVIRVPRNPRSRTIKAPVAGVVAPGTDGGEKR